MALEFNTSLIQVSSSFLKLLDVKFSKTSLKTLLVTNPYYPSLYSLSTVFHKFSIDTKSLKITDDQLDELALPFLAYVDIEAIGAKDFVNVIDVQAGSVTYIYKKQETISKADFIDKWSNVVFLAQANDKTRDVDFEKNRIREKSERNKSILLLLGFGVILISGAFTFIRTSHEYLPSCIYLSIIMIGLATSVLLLIHEVDKSNAFVKNICEGGVKTNCDAVLSSEASKLFNISWSELGFFYFAFLFLFLLLPFTTYDEKKPVITLLSSLTALYIPFSIYYQYRVVKQWCRLCLVIQATLLASFIWALAFGSFKPEWNIALALLFIFCAAFPMLTWYALKPIIVKAIDSDKHFASYKRLFTNQDIFKVIISEQPDAPAGWEKLGVHKGNDNAENILIKICSPTCGPCATAHGLFNEIMLQNKNVKLITIYEVTNAEETDFRRMFVSHMLALAEHEGGKNLSAAMDYWYLTVDRDFDVLMKAYPVPSGLLERQSEKIEAMRLWCKEAEIQYTPTVYLNGKKLARDLDVEELKNIL